jgi:hypothetical protein
MIESVTKLSEEENLEEKDSASKPDNEDPATAGNPQ